MFYKNVITSNDVARMVELDKQMDTQTESIVVMKENIAKTVNDNCNIVSSMETQLKE